MKAIIRAHKYSFKNREELQESSTCGCFYCKEVFDYSEIEDWCDEDQTALCPRCGIDSVIGSKSGFPIEKEFLTEMHRHWF